LYILNFIIRLDIPELDTIVLATPRASVEQSVGRIMRYGRKSERKPLVIDIVDEDAAPFRRSARKRLKSFKQQGYVVSTISVVYNAGEEDIEDALEDKESGSKKKLKKKGKKDTWKSIEGKQNKECPEEAKSEGALFARRFEFKREGSGGMAVGGGRNRVSGGLGLGAGGGRSWGGPGQSPPKSSTSPTATSTSPPHRVISPVTERPATKTTTTSPTPTTSSPRVSPTRPTPSSTLQQRKQVPIFSLLEEEEEEENEDGRPSHGGGVALKRKAAPDSNRSVRPTKACSPALPPKRTATNPSSSTLHCAKCGKPYSAYFAHACT